MDWLSHYDLEVICYHCRIWLILATMVYNLEFFRKTDKKHSHFFTQQLNKTRKKDERQMEAKLLALLLI